MNRGLIIPEIQTKEEGAEHLLGSRFRGVINPKGDWFPYLPIGELQNKGKFEPNACVSFGTNSCIETLIKFQRNIDINYSDRALAIKSNTDPNRGNDPHTVAETIRKSLGCVPEKELPFDETIDTLEKFYSPNPLSDYLVRIGNSWFNTFDFRHEWVFTSGTPQAKKALLKTALTQGTVGVAVYAWEKEGEVYIKPQGMNANHWVQLVKFDEKDRPVIFDSYAETDSTPFLKTLSSNYDFQLAKVFYVDNAQPKLSILQQILNFISQIVSKQKQIVDEVAPKTPEERWAEIDETPPPPVLPKYEWDTPEKARHSVRVICDEEGLKLEQKNLICAVIQAESGFNPKAVNYNKDSTGQVVSTDWGICQINDYYWIGKGTFPSAEYVLNNPERCVRWMIARFKEGKITLWSAYVNGSYKKYL